jgi:hypothetical protein
VSYGVTASHQAIGPPVGVPIVVGASARVVIPESAVAYLKLGLTKPALMISVDELPALVKVGLVVAVPTQNRNLYQAPGVTLCVATKAMVFIPPTAHDVDWSAVTAFAFSRTPASLCTVTNEFVSVFPGVVMCMLTAEIVEDNTRTRTTYDMPAAGSKDGA